MNTRRALLIGMIALATTAVPGVARGHCDTLDGPVVKSARDALEKGDVTPVLKWVKAEHEAEVKAAFALVVKVRAKGDDEKILADRYFFETLVRVHRAGEGAAYTGLKAAGEVEPMVKHLDEAIDKGNVDVVAEKVASKVKTGIKERFAKVLESKKHADESVEKGRAFVEAYVILMHYVEGIHAAMAGTVHAGHGAGDHRQLQAGLRELLRGGMRAAGREGDV